MLVVKDSSANKCGVVCSSYEILAAHLLSREAFEAQKAVIVAEVLDRLRALASLEANLLFREYGRFPGALPDFSRRISEAINLVADAIIATASDDGDVAGWDPRAAAAAAWRLAGAHAEATSAAFRPGDDHQVLTAGRDAAVKLWDLRAPGAPLRTFAGHHRPDARRKGIFHPRWVGGAAFAVGGEGSQRLAFYDAARGAAFASVKCAGDVTAVAPLPGGDALAVADDASGALALVPAPPRPSAP